MKSSLPSLFFRAVGCILLGFALTPATRAAGLITSHVDIRFDYAPEGWDCFLQYGISSEAPDIQADPETVALPVRDGATSSGGDRLVQPANPVFAFTGAAVGAPLWNLPQSDRGYTWPGFDNAQIPNTFLSYNNADPRVNATARWLRIALQSVEYSGESPTTPHFSLWTNGAFGTTLVWMATSDGISSQDAYFTTENSHSHLNWGFTALGIYRVTLRASAFLASNGQPVESGDHAVTFAIGTLATWRATHFAGLDLLDEAVGTPAADPDGDGLSNLQEYAFNTHPLTPSSVPWTPRIEDVLGVKRFTVEFLRRKSSTNPQITYIPEFSSTLVPGDWQATGTATVTPVDATWERVKVTDALPVEGRRYARVRVNLQSSISY
jgi:surface-anchored protein